MLKSYEAIYKDGQIEWLVEQPSVQYARLIVTVLEETIPSDVKRRTFPPDLVGQVKTSGDIVSPIVDEADWECLK
jgi:hypothetical protein